MRRPVLIAGLAVMVALAGGWLFVQRTMPGWYARLVYPLSYQDAIHAAAVRNDLDPALVAAIIYRESKFRESVSSDKGAVGLMEVLPSTAEEIARQSGGTAFVIGDLHDPRINILYGCFYLRRLLDHYNGSEIAAVAAYNAGQGNVDAWLANGGGSLTVSAIPFSETRAYVAAVERLKGIYRRAYGDRLGPRP